MNLIFYFILFLFFFRENARTCIVDEIKLIVTEMLNSLINEGQANPLASFTSRILLYKARINKIILVGARFPPPVLKVIPSPSEN